MIKSVIDIGTNTAHLLIGEVKNDRLKRTILKHREYTFLAEYGIDEIHQEPLDRLYKALTVFARETKEHKSEELLIIATDALRSAINGPAIQSKVFEITGSMPVIISGETEAHLIRRGVDLCLDIIPDNYLIMDIGGGSVEFIHIINGKKNLLISLPLGISRLYEMCKDSAVITHDILQSLKSHIVSTASEVIASCRSVASELTLIGSAGTFEIFLPSGSLENPVISHSVIDLDIVSTRYEEVLTMDVNDRSSLPWLPAVRSKYIVVALILMKTIIEEIQANKLIVSKYALKEGALISDFRII